MSLENLNYLVVIICFVLAGVQGFFLLFGKYRIEGWVIALAKKEAEAIKIGMDARLNRHWNRRQEDINNLWEENRLLRIWTRKLEIRLNSLTGLTQQALERISRRTLSNTRCINNLVGYINSNNKDRPVGKYTYDFINKEKPEELDEFLSYIFDPSPLQKAFKEIENEDEYDDSKSDIKSTTGFIQQEDKRYRDYFTIDGEENR